MTLNYISVDMTCFLCSIIFSVILMLFSLGYVSIDIDQQLSKSVVMLIGTIGKRQTIAMCLSTLVVDWCLLKYLTLSTQVRLLINWQKHPGYVLQGVKGKVHCLLLLACGLYQIHSYFDCIVVYSSYFLSIATLCRLLQLYYFHNLWSRYMPDLSAICVMMLVSLRLLWQNAVNFTQLFKYIKF